MLEYEVRYGENGWTSQLKEESVDNLITRVGVKPPREQFVNALECCCNRFYPDAGYRPWKVHENPHGKTAEEWLKDEAVEEWSVDWYWRVLITDLVPDFVDKQGDNNFEYDTITIKLSQIRRWVMLSAYHKDGDDKDMRLIRPPIFGRSARLTGKDQYWLYLDNEDDISTAWDSLSNESTDMERAYVMGRHTVVYEVSSDNINVVEEETNNKSERTGEDKRIDVGIEGDLLLHTHVQESDFELDLPSTHFEYWPHDLVKVPTYWNPGEHVDNLNADTSDDSTESDIVLPSHHESTGGESEVAAKEDLNILLASDEVCRVLEILSTVWNDPTHNSVHINAPPGSGKEILMEGIYWFKRHAGAKKTAVWTPGEGDLNRQVLFGTQSSNYNGLIDQAKNGCLVLDEIDKVDESTRSGLLRVIENGDYMVPGKGITTISSDEMPLFILLSSKPLDNVMDMGPKDLWTRIELTVDMSHPVDIVDEREKLRVLRQYFLLFWIVHVKEFIRKKDLLSNMGSVTPVSSFVHRVVALLISESFSREIADAFARAASNRRKNMSVRDIRTVAQRCVFNTIRSLLYMPHSGVDTTPRDAHGPLRIVDKLIYSGAGSEAMDSREVEQLLEMIVDGSLGGRATYPGR